MKNLSLSDFKFNRIGSGSYLVTFTSRKTCKEFTSSTNNISLIDSTKNSDQPKLVDLIRLKWVAKSSSKTFK